MLHGFRREDLNVKVNRWMPDGGLSTDTDAKWSVFKLNFLPVSSNIYRPTINSTGPNLKTALMTISSNHQNSKHDDVPNIMWTCICQLCIREDQNASKKTDILFWIHVYINLLKILKSYCQLSILSTCIFHIIMTVHLILLLIIIITTNIVIRFL